MTGVLVEMITETTYKADVTDKAQQTDCDSNNYINFHPNFLHEKYISLNNIAAPRYFVTFGLFGELATYRHLLSKLYITLEWC